MTRAHVAALVLAAGSSSRLGAPKQLLRISGRPLLERTLDVVRLTSLDPQIVVLGALSESIRREVNLGGFEIIENPAYQTGQASSLAAGLRAVPEVANGVVVVLGDQPLARSWQLEQLVDSFDPELHVAVRPRYSDGPGNPVLISRELIPELLELQGDVGAREVLARYRSRTAEIDLTGQPAPRDVDTKEDFELLLQDWASTGAPDTPRFCSRCGSEVGLVYRHQHLRPVCPKCDFTYFYDPKLAVAVVVEIAGNIVLQRRAIEPGIGRWTFPGGYVDRGEPLLDAARREVAEEVGLAVNELRLLGVYSEPGESVVLVAFAANADGQQPAIGDESSDFGLFEIENLPDLAFPRDSRVLTDWRG